MRNQLRSSLCVLRCAISLFTHPYPFVRGVKPRQVPFSAGIEGCVTVFKKSANLSSKARSRSFVTSLREIIYDGVQYIKETRFFGDEKIYLKNDTNPPLPITYYPFDAKVFLTKTLASSPLPLSCVHNRRPY